MKRFFIRAFAWGLGVLYFLYKPLAVIFNWRQKMLKLDRYTFLPTDVTVGHGATLVDGVGFTSREVTTGYAKVASLTLYVKGAHAGCSQDVVFKFAAYDSARQQWDTMEYLLLRATANGTSKVQRTVPINADMERIKLLSIQNQEVTEDYDVTANASAFVKEGA
jgi:hypothetical protein